MKITIKIEGKEYKLPTSYKDITLKRFKEIQKVVELSNVPKYLLKEIEDEPTEADLLKFYLNFINVITDIPKEQLGLVQRFTDGENIGIEDLFKSLTFLLVMPQETGKPVKKIKGLHFFDSSGIMKDNTLVEYTESSALSNAISRIQEGRFDYLNLIMAIFYRPRKLKWFKYHLEAYDSDKAIARTKLFDDVDMDTIFNAMFFFMQSRKDYLKSIEESLEERLEKARTGYKGSSGTVSSTTSQKVVYSLKED